MGEKLLLAINPASGDGAARLWLYDMVETLSERFSFVSVYISRASGDIGRFVAKEAANYDAVVCNGGDGTLSEMFDGIVKSGASPLIGYIPMGTTNDFAASHGISKNVKTALRQITDGTERVYDVGLLGERAFAYVAAFGAFTDVAYQTPQNAKSSFGFLAYLTEAARRLSKLKPIKMRYMTDGETGEGEFIYGMISNSKSIGGIKFFGTMDDDILSDGIYEVTLVRFPHGADKLYNAVRGLLDPTVKCKEVVRFRASDMRFEFDGEVPWTVDGEYGGDMKDAVVTVVPKRIRMIM